VLIKVLVSEEEEAAVVDSSVDPVVGFVDCVLDVMGFPLLLLLQDELFGEQQLSLLQYEHSLLVKPAALAMHRL